MHTSDDDRRRREAELARKEQREASSRARDSNDKGRWFHHGIAEIRGETRENGWRHEQSVRLPSGRERIHDNVRTVNDREFREYKGGKHVGGEFVMEQISKEREGLQADRKSSGSWIVREGALDPAARRELEKLEREFRGRFRVEEISKEQAKRALEVGKDLERNPNQLELVDSQVLRREQLAKERRERIQAKQLTKAAAQKAMEQRDRERREREARERTREAADRLGEYARNAREAASRGERVPMTGREVADILAVSFPAPPGERSPQQESPQAGSARSARERLRERERRLARERGLWRGHGRAAGR
ncbi:hypothetical protein [Nocardia sp. NPDC051750]|uniref:hypothetical protein n=1 Tax=Nocardia sp. NPDC051750 TaxID=3364325 RepID=UPI00379DE9F6